MQINQIVETDDGSFTYTATLNEAQHAFLIEYAIKDLISKGLLPFTVTTSKEDEASVMSVGTGQAS